MDDRNRPLTDEELDTILPTQGYEVIIKLHLICWEEFQIFKGNFLINFLLIDSVKI